MSMPSPDQMTPEQLAAMQAQLRAVEQFNIEAFTLLGIAIVFTGLRLFARISAVGFKRLQADDYLVVLGATFYAIETALAYCVGEVGRGLANNAMSDEQRATLDPSSEEYQTRVIGSKIQLCGWTSYACLLWSLKAAMCVFYLRLTDGLRGYRMRIYIGFLFIGASFVAVILNLFLSCRPFHHMWQIFPDPGIYCQPAISPALVYVFLSFNVATDLYLISIPLPMLWQSSMNLRRKMALGFLFTCGLFVTMAACLRVALLVTDPENGAMLAGSWAVRETFVAVITTNLPFVFPLFRKWLSPVFSLGTTLGRSKKTKSDSDGSSKPPTLETFGQKGRRARPPRSLHPITNITYNESEENIVEEVKMQELSRNGSSGNDSDKHSGAGSGGTLGGAGAGRGRELGIKRQVEVSVQRDDEYPLAGNTGGSMRKGNFTTVGGLAKGSMDGADTQQRSNYFVDHVHQENYRNV